MINDATRAADVIDRVRSPYRPDTSDRELLDVIEIIREMIILLHDKANRNSISIRTDVDSGLPLITADRVQLQQVLMNLILNGIEAMKDAKGELTVTSKRTDDGQLLISVNDSGLGLSVGEVDRIFDAFFTTKEQGTGMGLSISRRIIGLTEAICGRAPIRDAARHFSSHCLPTWRRIRHRPRNSATVDGTKPDARFHGPAFRRIEQFIEDLNW